MLILVTPLQSSPARQRTQVYLWTAVIFILFSVLVSFFRVKNRGKSGQIRHATGHSFLILDRLPLQALALILFGSKSKSRDDSNRDDSNIYRPLYISSCFRAVSYPALLCDKEQLNEIELEPKREAIYSVVVRCMRANITDAMLMQLYYVRNLDAACDLCLRTTKRNRKAGKRRVTNKIKRISRIKATVQISMQEE